MFHWINEVQSYNNDELGWNYIEQLHAVMEGDLLNDLKFEQTHFVDEVSGIFDQGCPNPPCDTIDVMQRVYWSRERKSNFRVALEALELPLKSSYFRQIEEFLMKGKDTFEEVILRSINPTDQKTYQSYRYQFSDFMESLRIMADIGFDDTLFYVGQSENVEEDLHVYSGMLNVGLFLSHAVLMSIRDDACDEHNTQVSANKRQETEVFHFHVVPSKLTLIFCNRLFCNRFSW
jgi:hypothetical protein